MKVGLAQINSTVGDLGGNVERCIEAITTAQHRQADLVVLPEMVIPGYPPRDILFDTSFTQAVTEATVDLAEQLSEGPPVIVGTIMPAEPKRPHHPNLYNAAVLLHHGNVELLAAKRLLPAYDVFHEPRWFIEGPSLPPIKIAGTHIGGLICEDLWDEQYATHPPADLIEAGAELLICISASPYRQGVMEKRLYHAQRQKSPLIYVNLCGATDELIFDGRSFVIDGDGNLVAQLAAFQEDVQVIDLGKAKKVTQVDNLQAKVDKQSAIPTSSTSNKVEPMEELFQALVLGVRDFAQKNRLERAYLGISGGIDSALVAIIAAEALGVKQVTGIAIPSKYTDPRSTSTAQTLAERLGIGFEQIALDTLYTAAEASLG
ncbi:MAG: nitrilase-related carbon-nitrogen hydrolase, partial [Chloroflexota bacterium]